jgi:phosphotransferase system  glucose/maltose/N-acetylglucosamine-specific IIC component
MNYLNITKYLYLVVGLVMTYSAITKWKDGDNYFLEIMLAVAAIFTFFFRSRFAKKFEERKKQQDQTQNNSNP